MEWFFNLRCIITILFNYFSKARVFYENNVTTNGIIVTTKVVYLSRILEPKLKYK